MSMRDIQPDTLHPIPHRVSRLAAGPRLLRPPAGPDERGRPIARPPVAGRRVVRFAGITVLFSITMVAKWVPDDPSFKRTASMSMGLRRRDRRAHRVDLVVDIAIVAVVALVREGHGVLTVAGRRAFAGQCQGPGIFEG